MIKLSRTRTNNAIHSNFRGVKRVAFNVELMTLKRDGLLDAAGSKKWKSSVWKQAKSQLLKESHGKCAYCESPTSVVAFGDVEHFRPKSVYWWLAYCLENHLPSCARCNQEAKKDKFPLIDPRKALKGLNVKNLTDAQIHEKAPQLTPDPLHEVEGMKYQVFYRQLKSEGPYLLNPYIDNPEDFFIWKADDILKEVKLAAAKPKYTTYVKQAEECFGINRQELKDHRYRTYIVYKKLRLILQRSQQGPVATRNLVQQMILDMKTDSASWAGMVRYFDTLPGTSFI